MSPTITAEKITLKCPLFCAEFISPDNLLVAGGGGEGKNGVGNKIVLLDVSKSSENNSDTKTLIRVVDEHELSKEEDACMSLAVLRPTQETSEKAGTVIALTGINSSEASIKGGKNEHLRVFKISGSTIIPASRQQFFTPTSEVEIYQRLLRTSPSGALAAIASGGGLATTASSEIVIVDTGTLTVRRKFKPDGKKVEVADLDISNDETIAYCTSSEIYITSTSKDDEEPKKVNWQTSPATKGSLRTIRFLTPKLLLAVLNFPQRTGSQLILIDVTARTSSGESEGRVLARRKLHKGIKAVTGMSCASVGAQGIVAVAGADQSIELLSVENRKIKMMKTFREVHPFQITKVSFSPPPPPPAAAEAETEDWKPVLRLATTSMGNTVVVFTIPLTPNTNGFSLPPRTSTIAKQTFISVLFSLIAVVIFAIALQVMFDARSGIPRNKEGKTLVEFTREGLLERLRSLGLQNADAESVDALLKGMEAGAASNPFGDESPSEVVREKNGVDKKLHKAKEVMVDEARDVGKGVFKGVVKEAVRGVVG
ncbi:hypothetical protein RUND412_000708 [Rhizina undulata]